MYFTDRNVPSTPGASLYPSQGWSQRLLKKFTWEIGRIVVSQFVLVKQTKIGKGTEQSNSIGETETETKNNTKIKEKLLKM